VWSRLALLASAVLATLLVLEVAIRVVTAFDTNYLDEIVSGRALAAGRDLTLGDLIRPAADHSIVYDLRPGVRGRFLGQPVAINSLGMRDAERSVAKRPGIFRILGLGDSHMFGWGVRRDETFLALLEKGLNARSSGREFEVWNLAVPGYNSVQEVETFAAKAPLLRPDLVIINWVGNDMDLPSFLAKRPDVYSVRRSFLVEFVRRRWRARRGKHVRSSTLVPVEVDPTTGLSNRRPEEVPQRYRPLLGMGNMLQALDRLASLARAYGIRPVVLFDWNDPQADPAKAESHDPSRLLVKRWCAARGYLVVDTEEPVLRYLESHGLDSGALRLSSSDPHPSALRHRLIAEELLAALVRSGAIDRTAPAGVSVARGR
jgi:GDSL-like Lipase/Acylhydrolase family